MNCYEKKNGKDKPSGVYVIFPYEGNRRLRVKVYCDMVTDGGGWTVIQRRMKSTPQEDFYRTWMEYALGFGHLNGEFWLGLDHIHALTEQASYEIRFDLADFEGQTRYAKYRFFYVHDRQRYYAVEVNGYSGTAGDSFGYANKKNFTAKDVEFDSCGCNCAQSYKGAWWYVSCHKANLNGLYHGGAHTSYADGVNWSDWHGYYYSLNCTEMKIRPAFP